MENSILNIVLPCLVLKKDAFLCYDSFVCEFFSGVFSATCRGHRKTIEIRLPVQYIVRRILKTLDTGSKK